MNPFRTSGMGRSWSPFKLGNSKGTWALASDVVIRDGNLPWGNSNPSSDRDIFDGSPPHRQGPSGFPSGANHVYADGSGRWVKWQQLRFFHSWSLTARRSYFYQDYDGDFSSAFLNSLNNDPAMRIGP